MLTGFVSRDIHVRHNSKVKIIIRDTAKAFIRVYDKAQVIVENESDSRCFVYKKGGTAVVRGNVKIRNYKLEDWNWKIIK